MGSSLEPSLPHTGVGVLHHATGSFDDGQALDAIAIQALQENLPHAPRAFDDLLGRHTVRFFNIVRFFAGDGSHKLALDAKRKALHLVLGRHLILRSHLHHKCVNVSDLYVISHRHAVVNHSRTLLSSFPRLPPSPRHLEEDDDGACRSQNACGSADHKLVREAERCRGRCRICTAGNTNGTNPHEPCPYRGIYPFFRRHTLTSATSEGLGRNLHEKSHAVSASTSEASHARTTAGFVSSARTVIKHSSAYIIRTYYNKCE